MSPLTGTRIFQESRSHSKSQPHLHNRFTGWISFRTNNCSRNQQFRLCAHSRFRHVVNSPARRKQARMILLFLSPWYLGIWDPQKDLPSQAQDLTRSFYHRVLRFSHWDKRLPILRSNRFLGVISAKNCLFIFLEKEMKQDESFHEEFYEKRLIREAICLSMGRDHCHIKIEFF